MAKNSILEKLRKHLKSNPEISDVDYYIPALWAGILDNDQPQKRNFNTHYLQVMENILDKANTATDYSQSLSKIHKQKHGIGGDWSYTSQVYNMFPRLTLAYDHDNDGHVGHQKGDITLDSNQLFRETGTFLKAISVLPYIQSLGCNVIYMLPITSIGEDGNRGDLGSPYAIKNQYHIDPNLAEPLVPFTVEEQFKAFVEAAHIMGIRVVLEFVLRTNSLGGDWVKEHPDWFYWIDKSRVEEYKSPEFPDHELAVIKQIPKGGGFHFAPSKEYRSLFKTPPKPSQVKNVDGKWVAKTKEGVLVIPGAFADWPPDDIQPPWSDVTYLRMYNYAIDPDADNDYNYIAYNTIRYYDPELAQEQYVNRPLWDKLKGVIPHYQKEFGIDGVMLDMGHALPKPLLQEIIDEVRKVDEDFSFWEENFEIDWASRVTGFNATLGFEWRTTGKDKGGIKNVIYKSSENLGLPFFGTPETHNTPRAMQRGGEMHAKQLWAINSFLPNCLPLIHSGYELMEDYPVNTGLNFTQQELNTYQGHRLGLFFKNSYNWNRMDTLIPFMLHINHLRQKHYNLIATGNEHSIFVHYPESPFGWVTAFERFDPWHPEQSILVIANTNYDHSEKFYLNIPGTFNNLYKEYITGRDFRFVDHWVSATIESGEVLIFELHKLL